MKRLRKFDAAQFHRDGFQVIANVFSPTEIEQMRTRLRSVVKTVPGLTPGDLLSLPSLRHVLLDDRMLGLARQVLGCKPCYYGDSSGNIEAGTGWVWHKDNADRDDPNGPDWSAPFTVFRFGIYLQDHARYSGGVNVRRASHRPRAGADLHSGETVYIASQIGDVVIWPLTMPHAAKDVQLRLLRRLTLEPSPPPHLPAVPAIVDRAYKWLGISLNPLPRFLFRPMQKTRMALFMDFAKKDAHLERNLSFLKSRQYMVEIWRNSHYDRDALDALRGKDVELYDYWNQVQSEPGRGRENFYQIDDYYRARSQSAP